MSKELTEAQLKKIYKKKLEMSKAISQVRKIGKELEGLGV